MDIHEPARKLSMLRGISKPSELVRETPRVPVSGVIKDNYMKRDAARKNEKRKGRSADLHWIGGVPVDVRQAGTGGLPREGLHHGQQQEK